MSRHRARHDQTPPCPSRERKHCALFLSHTPTPVRASTVQCSKGASCRRKCNARDSRKRGTVWSPAGPKTKLPFIERSDPIPSPIRWYTPFASSEFGRILSGRRRSTKFYSFMLADAQAWGRQYDRRLNVRQHQGVRNCERVFRITHCEDRQLKTVR